MKKRSLFYWLAAMLISGAAPSGWGASEPEPPVEVEVPAWLTQPMSLVEAINIALGQNAEILKARSDLEAAQGVVIQTRAVALPQVLGTANYARDEAVEVPNVGTNRFWDPIKDRWAGNIRVTQAVYAGGRILSALRSVKLIREQSMLRYQAVMADTLLEVRTAYYNVLLAEQEIVVQQASVNLLAKQLEDVTRRFQAGTIPRFDVLRAEVELANAQPRLFRAENAYRIAKNNLANLLGYDVPPSIWEDIPLTLTGKLEAQPYEIDLPAAIARALRFRPELGAFQKAELLRREDVVQAKATYKPLLEIFGGYGARNSSFTDDFYQDVAGANAGVQLTWKIWDGNQARGRVKEARALYERAQVDTEDTRRRIELEVRTAYSSFLEAKRVLSSQLKVLEQGDEALRLARSRYEAGTGTQLDVLDAQTALTDARTTNVRALREYSVALARLQRAVGWDVAPPTAEELELLEAAPAPVAPPPPPEEPRD